MSIQSATFGRRRLLEVHFYRHRTKTISALFTETYATAVYEMIPGSQQFGYATPADSG